MNLPLSCTLSDGEIDRNGPNFSQGMVGDLIEFAVSGIALQQE